MAQCVAVVLGDRRRLQELRERLEALTPPPTSLLAVGPGEMAITAVDRLNPAVARRQRQRSMVRWLLPFGFFAGLMFTFITDLHTFGFAGPYGEPVIGGLLGMGSGWMGSFAAAASVSSEEDDRIRILRNRVEEGNWLLLMERAGEDIPWTAIQKAGPKAVVRLEDR